MLLNKMTFSDAKTILMGNEHAAASIYKTTSTALYAKFNPVIRKSFTK